LALREAGLKGERGLRAPGEGCVLLRATATSKAAAAKCCPRRHQSHSTIGRKHRRHRRLRSHRWPSPADGWLKTLDFTGQGAGRHSFGVIFSSPIETRQAPRSHLWPSPADGWLKALDFTGQGAGRHSNGVIFSSPIETRQAPSSAHQLMKRAQETHSTGGGL